MQFITTDQRIAVENFQIGLIYTVTFTGGRYFSGACIGKGADFVMFQRTAPELVYCLNMAAAEDVESIEQTGGGGGTLNYNDLYNKPQINGVELAGNKSLDNLDIQPKLSAAQLSATNSGITADDVAQIETNKNNILLKANADNTAYKTAATSFSGTNMQCVFDSAMFTSDNRRGSVLMLFGSQKTSINNTLLIIDFNDAGIRSIRRLTDGASEVIMAIGAISSDKQSFAFTANGNSYTYPCLISMFADKDIKPNFTIVAQT